MPSAPEVRPTGPSPEGGDVVGGGVGGLGCVGEYAEIAGRRETALERVEDADPGDDLLVEGGHPHLGLAEQPGVSGLPAVEGGDVLVGDVVDRHEDLLEGVLD